MTHHIALRPVHSADLDAIFEAMRDPESVRMAAFTAEDPDDRQWFDEHMKKLQESPEITLRAITCDGALVGSIASFVIEGQTEVAYWIDRRVWGRGIASRALELFLGTVKDRPLYGRAARDNLGSLQVLAKAGFTAVGSEMSFANARGTQIEEMILRLG
jgi:RimJ/RimL family protein N-acetyltransferase